MRAALLLFAVSLAAGLAVLLVDGGLAQGDSRQARPGTVSDSKCGTCHPAERVAFAKSRHALEGVSCASCHGGNDQSLEVSTAHGSGFIGVPSRQNGPRLCASCHADERRMRAYNLPVDQYALYQTSGHGKALASGNTRAAVCSDCHGAHDILPSREPASRTFRLNVARNCGQCHGDQDLVPTGGSGGNPYEDYSSSVHANALQSRSNLNAPTCISCHGVHGAAPPEVGDVDKICGQCHTVERRYFLSGPHDVGLDLSGRAQCASCHGNHAITPAQPERLGTMCAECHGDDSRQAALGQRMWTEYEMARADLEKAGELIEEAEAVPLHTEDYHSRLEEANTYLKEALPAAHSVDEAIVTAQTSRARSVGQEIQKDIQAKLGNLGAYKLVLIVFWFYLILTILVLRWYMRRESGS
jgi:hypothetical protein